MKKYHFPHERILAIRRLESAAIQARLERHHSEVRKQDEFRREIARQVRESAEAARQPGVTATELAGAENFARYASRADLLVAEQQRRSMAELEKEQQLFIAAERKVAMAAITLTACERRWPASSNGPARPPRKKS